MFCIESYFYPFAYASIHDLVEFYSNSILEDTTTMQLIPKEIHRLTGHTGGVAVLKQIGNLVLGGIIIGAEILDALDPITYLTSGDTDPPPGFTEGPFGTWVKVECESCDEI